ncbi:anaerobic sulfatase maturase [bacterium]|nr:anaerobic sulfatase maturase [bacterium]
MKLPQKKLNSVLIKPAGPDCNMHCTYCFYLEKKDLFKQNKIHRMDEQTLEETIRQVMTHGGSQVSFGWQGGEPTLMGLQFFKKAVQLQERFGFQQSVGNGLQTNGLLLDYKWAQFLKKYHFLVGLSLDGPEHIHNHYRRLKNGDGSWSRVTYKAQLLLDEGVAVNALTAVNNYSVQFPDEIYQFHKDLGLNYMQFIPCVETDPDNPSQAAPFSVSSTKYGEFLCRLFDLWVSDFVNGQPMTSIRFFESVFYHYVGLQPPECNLLPQCGIYLVIEHNGDVYSCDFFVEPEWKLGNIKNGNLTEMLNSRRQNKFGKIKSNLPPKCQSCPWLKYCWGGCTKDRIKDPRDKGLNHFCESYQMFFNHADSFFKKLAQEWKSQQ